MDPFLNAACDSATTFFQLVASSSFSCIPSRRHWWRCSAHMTDGPTQPPPPPEWNIWRRMGWTTLVWSVPEEVHGGRVTPYPPSYDRWLPCLGGGRGWPRLCTTPESGSMPLWQKAGQTQRGTQWHPLLLLPCVGGTPGGFLWYVSWGAAQMSVPPPYSFVGFLWKSDKILFLHKYYSFLK